MKKIISSTFILSTICLSFIVVSFVSAVPTANAGGCLGTATSEKCSAIGMLFDSSQKICMPNFGGYSIYSNENDVNTNLSAKTEAQCKEVGLAFNSASAVCAFPTQDQCAAMGRTYYKKDYISACTCESATNPPVTPPVTPPAGDPGTSSLVGDTGTAYPYCTDTDAGQKNYYFIKGTVSSMASAASNLYKKDDSCRDSNTLIENQCVGSVANSVAYTCPNGCKDGACVSESGGSSITYPICTDTDAGQKNYYYIKGSADLAVSATRTDKRDDVCADSNTLSEAICSNGANVTESYKCPNGCKEGACVDTSATCSDKIKNGTETGVDCGGSCQACNNQTTGTSSCKVSFEVLPHDILGYENPNTKAKGSVSAGGAVAGTKGAPYTAKLKLIWNCPNATGVKYSCTGAVTAAETSNQPASGAFSPLTPSGPGSVSCTVTANGETAGKNETYTLYDAVCKSEYQNKFLKDIGINTEPNQSPFSLSCPFYKGVCAKGTSQSQGISNDGVVTVHCIPKDQDKTVSGYDECKTYILGCGTANGKKFVELSQNEYQLKSEGTSPGSSVSASILCANHPGGAIVTDLQETASGWTWKCNSFTSALTCPQRKAIYPAESKECSASKDACNSNHANPADVCAGQEIKDQCGKSYGVGTKGSDCKAASEICNGLEYRDSCGKVCGKGTKSCTFTLDVSKAKGVTITSADGKINCADGKAIETGACSVGYASSEKVSLKAVPSTLAVTFEKWTGACNGTNKDECEITMDRNKDVNVQVKDISGKNDKLLPGDPDNPPKDDDNYVWPLPFDPKEGILSINLNVNNTLDAVNSYENRNFPIELNQPEPRRSGIRSFFSIFNPASWLSPKPSRSSEYFGFSNYTLDVRGARDVRIVSDDGKIDCENGRSLGRGGCSAQYGKGDKVSLNAEPKGVLAIVNWFSGCNSVNQSVCLITMDANKSLSKSVSYAKIPVDPKSGSDGTFTTVVSAVSAGSADPSREKQHFSWFRYQTYYTLDAMKAKDVKIISEDGKVGCQNGADVDGGKCLVEYKQGSEISLKAVPTDSKNSVKWGGECNGIVQDKCNLTMGTSKDLTTLVNYSSDSGLLANSIDNTPTNITTTETTTTTVSKVSVATVNVTSGAVGPTAAAEAPAAYMLDATNASNLKVVSDDGRIGCENGKDFGEGKCKVSYTKDSSLSLAATSADPAIFVKWSGACKSTDQNKCAIVMDADKTLSMSLSSVDTTTVVNSTTAPAQQSFIPSIAPAVPAGIGFSCVYTASGGYSCSLKFGNK